MRRRLCERTYRRTESDGAGDGARSRWFSAAEARHEGD